jgi:HSP20 family protein
MSDKVTDAMQAIEGDDIVLEAHLPGIEPDQVKVEVAAGVLTVSGECREKSGEEEEGGGARHEHRNSFSRSVILPRGVDLTRLRTSVEDGTVRVTIPRSESG